MRPGCIASSASSTQRYGARTCASAALRAAMPLRSEPEEAAVGAVLGTLPVVVAVIRTRSSPIPNSSATTWATLT